MQRTVICTVNYTTLSTYIQGLTNCSYMVSHLLLFALHVRQYTLATVRPLSFLWQSMLLQVQMHEPNTCLFVKESESSDAIACHIPIVQQWSCGKLSKTPCTLRCRLEGISRPSLRLRHRSGA